MKEERKGGRKRGREERREEEEALGGDGYIYGTDCGDGLKSVCLSPNPPSCIH